MSDLLDVFAAVATTVESLVMLPKYRLETKTGSQDETTVETAAAAGRQCLSPQIEICGVHRVAKSREGQNLIEGIWKGGVKNEEEAWTEGTTGIDEKSEVAGREAVLEMKAGYMTIRGREGSIEHFTELIGGIYSDRAQVARWSTVAWHGMA